ncbi:hypothetical protein RCL1_003597 [Eukaryota sp. TZLM3-RCL]
MSLFLSASQNASQTRVLVRSESKKSAAVPLTFANDVSYSELVNQVLSKLLLPCDPENFGLCAVLPTQQRVWITDSTMDILPHASFIEHRPYIHSIKIIVGSGYFSFSASIDETLPVSSLLSGILTAVYPDISNDLLSEFVLCKSIGTVPGPILNPNETLGLQFIAPNDTLHIKRLTFYSPNPRNNESFLKLIIADLLFSIVSNVLPLTEGQAVELAALAIYGEHAGSLKKNIINYSNYLPAFLIEDQNFLNRMLLKGFLSLIEALPVYDVVKFRVKLNNQSITLAVNKEGLLLTQSDFVGNRYFDQSFASKLNSTFIPLKSIKCVAYSDSDLLIVDDSTQYLFSTFNQSKLIGITLSKLAGISGNCVGLLLSDSSVESQMALINIQSQINEQSNLIEQMKSQMEEESKIAQRRTEELTSLTQLHDELIEKVKTLEQSNNDSSSTLAQKKMTSLAH